MYDTHFLKKKKKCMILRKYYILELIILHIIKNEGKVNCYD